MFGNILHVPTVRYIVLCILFMFQLTNPTAHFDKSIAHAIRISLEERQNIEDRKPQCSCICELVQSEKFQGSKHAGIRLLYNWSFDDTKASCSGC